MLSLAASLLFTSILVPTDPGPAFNGRLGQLGVKAPRIDATPVVDGNLDEPAWQQAARLTGFSQYQPVDGVPAQDSTEVLVWYSPTAIHFGIRAYAEPGTVRATLGDRDRSFNDDYIGIFLSTLGDRRRALVFSSNPLGVQGDGIVVEGNSSGSGGFGAREPGREPTDISPDFVYASKGHLTDFGYQLEISIPFKSLRFQSASSQSWGFNVMRKVQSRGEEHSWAPARRAAASYLAQIGSLDDLQGLHRGRVVEVSPIITERSVGRQAADHWEYDAQRAAVGGNFRLGVTNELTLNGTFRPDFAEVETDAGQLIADPRLALYLPEKRPFFLDASEQFSVPSSLIYTRNIVAPIAAAKMTGTLSGFSLGSLVARDSRSSSFSEDPAHPIFTWLRLQRSVGRSSGFGLMYTGREDGSNSNRVAGGDAQIVFGKNWSGLAQLAVSRTEDGTETRTGPMWRMNLNRAGRHFGARYALSSIDRDFETQSGFISRGDLAHANASHSYTLYGREGGLLRTIQSEIVMDGTWRSHEFPAWESTLERKLHFNTNYGLRGGWRLGASVLVERFSFDPVFYSGYAVEHRRTTPQGEVVEYAPFTGTPHLDNLDYVVSIAAPNFKSFSFDGLYLWGKDENFYEWSSADIGFLSANLSWRPTSQFRLAQSFTMQDFRRRSDGTLAGRDAIPRTKIEYQISRSLLLRAVGEYSMRKVDDRRDDSRTNDPLVIRRADGTYRRLTAVTRNTFTPQILFAYTPSPGTVFFAGYAGTMRENESFRIRTLHRDVDGFFVKASYLIRR